MTRARASTVMTTRTTTERECYRTTVVFSYARARLHLGLVVAREMGWATPPAFKASLAQQSDLPPRLTIANDGKVS